MTNQFPQHFLAKNWYDTHSSSQIRKFANACIPNGWQAVTEGKVLPSFRYFYLQNDGYGTFRAPKNIQLNDDCSDYWCVIRPFVDFKKYNKVQKITDPAIVEQIKKEINNEQT